MRGSTRSPTCRTHCGRCGRRVAGVTDWDDGGVAGDGRRDAGAGAGDVRVRAVREPRRARDGTGVARGIRPVLVPSYLTDPRRRSGSSTTTGSRWLAGAVSPRRPTRRSTCHRTAQRRQRPRRPRPLGLLGGGARSATTRGTRRRSSAGSPATCTSRPAGWGSGRARSATRPTRSSRPRASCIAARRPITVDLLYGDHEGGAADDHPVRAAAGPRGRVDRGRDTALEPRPLGPAMSVAAQRFSSGRSVALVAGCTTRVHTVAPSPTPLPSLVTASPSPSTPPPRSRTR